MTPVELIAKIASLAPVGGARLVTYVPEPGPRIEQRTLGIEDRSPPARPATLANNAIEAA